MGEFQLIGLQKIGPTNLQYIVQPDITLIGTNNASHSHHSTTMLSTSNSSSGTTMFTGNSTLTTEQGDLLHAFLPLLDRSNLSSPVSYGIAESKHGNIVYAELQQLRATGHDSIDLGARHSLATYGTPTKLQLDSSVTSNHIRTNSRINTSTMSSSTTDPTLDLLCERSLLHQLAEKKALSNAMHSPSHSLSPGQTVARSVTPNKHPTKGSAALSSISSSGFTLSRILRHTLLWLLLACAVVLAVLCLATLAHTTLLFGKSLFCFLFRIHVGMPLFFFLLSFPFYLFFLSFFISRPLFMHITFNRLHLQTYSYFSPKEWWFNIYAETFSLFASPPWIHNFFVFFFVDIPRDHFRSTVAIRFLNVTKTFCSIRCIISNTFISFNTHKHTPNAILAFYIIALSIFFALLYSIKSGKLINCDRIFSITFNQSRYDHLSA